MFKRSVSLAALAVLVGFIAPTPSLHAQAAPTATKGGGNLQVGVGAMYLNTDYDSTNYGLAAYADYDFFKFVGLEGEVRLGGIVSPTDITENSYLFGPRFTYHRKKLTGYVKVLFGEGTIKNQDAPASQTYFDRYNPGTSYFAYALGGGLEYRVKKHYNIRVIDFETQNWGNFEPNSLTPLAITVGVSYVIR